MKMEEKIKQAVKAARKKGYKIRTGWHFEAEDGEFVNTENEVCPMEAFIVTDGLTIMSDALNCDGDFPIIIGHHLKKSADWVNSFIGGFDDSENLSWKDSFVRNRHPTHSFAFKLGRKIAKWVDRLDRRAK